MTAGTPAPVVWRSVTKYTELPISISNNILLSGSGVVAGTGSKALGYSPEASSDPIPSFSGLQGSDQKDVPGKTTPFRLEKARGYDARK